MIKRIVLFASLICLVCFALFIVTNRYNPDFTLKENTSFESNNTPDKPKDKDTTLEKETNNNTDNSESKQSTNNDTIDKSVQDGILVSLNEKDYIAVLNTDTGEVSIDKVDGESSATSDKYVSIDYENVKPIVESYYGRTDFTPLDYLSIYSEVKPYVDTNISFSEAIKLVNILKAQNIDFTNQDINFTK